MNKRINKKNIYIIAVGIILLFCLTTLLLTTDITTKANAESNSAKESTIENNNEMTQVAASDEDNYDYVYIDYAGEHFLHDKTFEVPLVINTESRIIDYTYKQNGFNVLSVNTVKNNQINFELRAISNLNEYWLSLQVNLESEKTINGMLYAVVKDSGIFISQFSKDDALEKYFDYSLKNGTLTEDEISTLRRQNYSSSVIETSYTVMGKDANFKEPITNESILSNKDLSLESNTVQTRSGEDTYVSGKLEWVDDNDNIHPLRRVMVKICDYDSALVTQNLGTVYTDNEGNYSFAFENADSFWDFENGGYDIFIKAYAGTNNAMVVMSDGTSQYYYTSDDQGHMNVETGSTTIINMRINMFFDLGKAFQISQAVLTARDFAWNRMDSMPSDVIVRYPYGTNCSYSNSENRINITGNPPSSSGDPESYASWDVIMHEYGHHIQYDLDINDSPRGEHFINTNLADDRNNKDEGIKLAWAESWPTVFGFLAQKYYGNYLEDIDTVNNTSYESYNGINRDIETTSVCLGEACEMSIMAVLWDLYDYGSETNDTISLTYQAWWDVTTDGQDKTFSDFINYFYSEYPQYVEDIGANLSYYEMAPANISCSTLTSTPPTFNWSAQGGSINFPNNSFKLKIFNKDHSLAITTLSTTNTSITLSTSQWNTVLGWTGEKIYVTVVGYQTDSPSTGGYVSEYIELTKPIYITDITAGEATITGTYYDLEGSVAIPSTLDGATVKHIGGTAFWYQSDITSITLPSTIETIGFSAFYSCTNLSSVNLASTVVTSLGDYAFTYCPITSLSFPSSLSDIGDCVFENIEATRIIIPSSITNIGNNAFEECNSLTIYTENSSRPSTWNANWNNSARPVVWGCTLSSGKTYIVSFVKSTTNPSNPNATNGITQPYRSGYSFGGWYTTSNYSGTQYMDVTTAPNGTLYAKWNKNSCVAEGTLVTLADGSQKAVELLTMDDLLLVWNHHTGAFDVAPMVFIDSDPLDAYEIIHLYFSDGTDVKVIYEHAFWNATLNKYVFIRDGEAMQYIGDWFNKQTYDINGNMIWENVQLVDVQIYTEQTTAWSPVTFSHLNFYVNGMLSMPGATEGLINIFEVDSTSLQYNQAAFQADIQTYGLFTYEEFAEIIPVPEIVFEAFNGQYLKVSIGKGLINIDDLITLVERYSEFFSL